MQRNSIGCTSYKCNTSILYAGKLQLKFNITQHFVSMQLTLDVPWLARNGGKWGVCCELARHIRIQMYRPEKGS